MYEYLFIQAALEVDCVMVAPEDDIASLEIVQTVADSDDPTAAYPK